ncbi:MAG: LacI family DNA-binding transcriptional regulator [Rectinemataceae bacterium]|nr:LacI family DNA-binding transcriptional regulator [Rectinemataceae bacterium]
MKRNGKLISIIDVAAEAGVSTASVSRVLANKPTTREDIKERVLAAVKKLNYRPNRIAQSLRNRQSNTIGLIVSDFRHPFFTLISRAVEEMAYSKGMAVLLFNSDENPSKEALCLELLKDEYVSGAIIAPTSNTANSTTKQINLGIPIVAINRKIQSMDVDSVLTDNFDSAYKLVSHLVDDGYTRIGGIFSNNNSTVRARYEGFRRALQDRNIAHEPELEYMCDTTEENGYEGAKILLQKTTPPEVVIAANGSMATGAYRSFRDCGINIPQDIGFACFDESPWTTLVNPQITVIRQPTYDIGKSAIELLFSRIAEPDRPIRDIVLRGELIIRESCKKPGSHAHDTIAMS